MLRRGYTTGTCAAAAAKAAATMLLSGKKIREVDVTLPTGKKIVLKITDAEINENHAQCCVVKDAGDDPDVTNGAKICAMVRKIKCGVAIRGGEGVGVVTKRGLQIPVGEAAINHVPRKMILQAVSEAASKDRGIEITIFVPNGKELAKRTLNEKLGIVGGISIIGTTGIVEPRSEEAFRASLVPQIDVALANGYDEIVLTPGRIGERNALARGIPEDAVVQMGNFAGFMLEECAKRSVKKVLLFGHVSKVAKIAAGFFNTHSKFGDAKSEIAACVSLFCTDEKIAKTLLEANTTEEAIEILREKNLTHVFDLIAQKASERAAEHVNGKMRIGVILASLKGEVIGKDKNARTSRWAKFLL